MKTKDLIFDKAITLFALHGYEGTSIRMISKEVGINESSLYNHFAGKKQLMDAIIDKCDELFQSENPAIDERYVLADNLGLQETLHFLINKYIIFWKKPKNMELWQTISNEQYRNKKAAMVIIQEIERRIERLTATFDHLQKHHKMLPCDSQQLAILFIYSTRSQFLDYVLSLSCLPDSEHYIERMYQTTDILANLYEVK